MPSVTDHCVPCAAIRAVEWSPKRRHQQQCTSDPTPTVVLLRSSRMAGSAWHTPEVGLAAGTLIGALLLSGGTGDKIKGRPDKHISGSKFGNLS